MSFLDWLSGKSEVEPPPPPNREFGPQADDWKSDLPPEALNPVDRNKDGIPDVIAGLCVSIDYVDASGGKSTRRILIDDIYSEGGTCYVDAYCLLREDQRTFRADRITSLRIPPDWRAVSDPISFLTTYLPADEALLNGADFNSYSETARRYSRLYNVRRAANHGLRVLAFVARCDGNIADEELSAVRVYVRDAAALVSEEMTESDCAEIAADIEGLFPTKRQVANSLDALRMYREQSEIFMSALQRLVRADGVITEHEQSAVQMLVEILQKQQKRDKRRA